MIIVFHTTTATTITATTTMHSNKSAIRRSRGNIKPREMASFDLPYRAEYAKSGRASCKSCKGLISKDTLRMAQMVQVLCITQLYNALLL